MSILESMNIGSNALKTHGLRLDIHAKNIANIDTPNYVRRIPVLNATEDISFHGLMNTMKNDVFGVGTLPYLQGGVVFNGCVEDPTVGERIYSPGHPDADANGYGGYALPETDLVKELESFGITPVTFPEAMVRKECKITKIENITVNESISLDANVEFTYNENIGSLMIRHFRPMDTEWTGSSTVMDVEAGEMINVNGMDVLVFEQEKTCAIMYKDNSTKYTFYIECDFETAKEFAKTIK